MRHMGEGPTQQAPLRLPEGFVFGTSTASYQIEGAVTEDGRGPSIWDTFCAEPGRINDASSGAVACDHYHRYAEDVALMARLGAQGYRFSIAWSRVQPTGAGRVNEPGLAFYDRLVDELLAHDIGPMATLYHWDLPQALEDAGGWLSRDTAERFAEYAALVADRLADRVAHWVPVNEPNVASLLGYALGMHAPGKALMFDALPAAHHLLLGHGLATRALRAAGANAVGTANNHAPMWPASDSEADRAAADLFDTVWNRIFADPILLGRYPEGFAELMGARDEDLTSISQRLDFYGVNYYNPMCVAAPADPTSAMPFDQREITGYPTTDFGWPVVPDGLRELLVLLKARYPDLPPLLITENGCSYGTGLDEDGVVDDQPRIDYLDGHLRAVAAAIDEGVDVRGYYCWSLMDNFEWTEGYTQRFGLVHVDYETQARTPKRSFDWYAATIRAHR
jgi:beta-glucosidase